MYLAFFHSTRSRSASAARRSVCGALIGNGVQLRLARAFALRQGGQQQPVHHQVGIAADGRSEVRVRLGGQREVAGVVGAVARLLERPQHELAENALLGLAFDLRHQLLILPRRDGDTLGQHDLLARLAAVAPRLGHGETAHGNGPHPERVAEGGGDFFELHHAARVGRLVNAVNERHRGHAGGHRFIGGQHELLDDAVRDVARGAAHPGHGAPLVEFDHGLGQVEVDGAAARRRRVSTTASSRISSKRGTSAR